MQQIIEKPEDGKVTFIEVIKDNAYDQERGNQEQIAGLDIYFIQKEEKIEFSHKESFKDKKTIKRIRIDYESQPFFLYIAYKPRKMQ